MLSETSLWHITMPVGGGIHAINNARYNCKTQPLLWPNIAPRFTADYATGEFGDLIDLLHAKLGSRSLHETLLEAQHFLGNAPLPETRISSRKSEDDGAANTKRIASARKLFAAGSAILGTAAPPTYTVAASHALGLPCAIILGSIFVVRTLVEINHATPLPFWQKLRKIRAISLTALGHTSTRSHVVSQT